MFSRSFFGARYYAPRYFGDGGDVVAETTSGGWGRSRRTPFHDESASAREARIHAERVRLGILAPDPVLTPALSPVAERERIPAALDVGAPLHPDPGLALDLAQLYTGAYLDAEISRYFRLLEDEDDAAVLLLAIATLH